MKNLRSLLPTLLLPTLLLSSLTAQAAAPAPGTYMILDPSLFDVLVSTEAPLPEGTSSLRPVAATHPLPSRAIPLADFPEGVAAGLPGARAFSDDPHLTLQVNGPAVDGSPMWSVDFPNGVTQNSDSRGSSVRQSSGSVVTLPVQIIAVPGFRPSCRLEGRVTQEVFVNAEGRPIFKRSALVNIRDLRSDCTAQLDTVLNGLVINGTRMPGLMNIMLNPDQGGDRWLEIPAVRTLLDMIQPGLGAQPQTVRSLHISAESPLLTPDQYVDAQAAFLAGLEETAAATPATEAAPVGEPAGVPVPLDHRPERRLSDR